MSTYSAAGVGSPSLGVSVSLHQFSAGSMMALRLWWINVKRGPGVWLFPLFALLAWYAGQRGSPAGITMWLYTSTTIGLAAILISPVVAGAAAWAALQSRRQQVDRLLTLLPGTRLPHDLTTVGALLAWAWFAYLANGVLRGLLAARDATWGTLDPLPVLIGLLTIAVATAVGYLCGTIMPSLLTPPLTAITLFVAIMGSYGYDMHSSLRNLSPMSFLDLYVQWVVFRFWPSITPPLTSWLLGLCGVALGIIALRYHPSVRASGFLLASATLAALGATQLLQQPPRLQYTHDQLVPYEPACLTSTVKVCVHPAYRAVLPTTAAIADAVFGPTIGLPGMPTRIEQFASARARGNILPTGVVDLDVYSPRNGRESLVKGYVYFAIQSRRDAFDLSPAQCAMGRWLARRAGMDPTAAAHFFMPRTGYSSREEYDALDRRLNAAAARFGALSPADQRAWFERHWTALREGQLSLDALP